MHKSIAIAVASIPLVLVYGCGKNTSQQTAPLDPTANLELSQVAFDFGETDSAKFLTVTSQRDDSTAWWIDSRRYFVRVSPSAGTLPSGPDTVRIEVDRKGLPVGTQTAVFDVVQLPDSVRTTVHITLEVPPPPPILPALSTDSLDFPNGTMTQHLFVENLGQISFDWRVEHSWTAPWLILEPDSGKELLTRDSIVARLSLDRYPPGHLQGKLTIRFELEKICIGYLSAHASTVQGELLAAFNFFDSEFASQQWEGNWEMRDSMAIAGQRCSMRLRPEFAPVITDYRNLYIRFSAGGNLWAFLSGPQGVHLTTFSATVNGVPTVRIGDGANDWALKVSPYSPTPEPGVLDLIIGTIYPEEGRYYAGRVWIREVEFWSK